MNTTLLPAIRSRVGDWITYVTTMSFKDVQLLVKAPDEIHERKGLSDWIQREAIESHVADISNYIQENPQRFLGALIIGVYDGNPNWAPLNVNFTFDHLEISETQKDNIEGKLGLLHLSGNEKLFAIDGQHRIAGIKKVLSAVDINSSIFNDEVSAVFVAHDGSSVAGKQRTRRLFTTLNKKAKTISKTATIALDEDNGFAIVTRQLIDAYWLFEDSKRHISYSSTGAISAQDEWTITSVVGLYEIVKDLYFQRNKKEFESSRPTDEVIACYLAHVIQFLDLLMEHCPEYLEVFVHGNANTRYYREQINHLLFRPIGQRVFARAVQVLVQRGQSLHEAVSSLLEVDMIIGSTNWQNILWDPIGKTMITKRLVLAESQLLHLAGHDARTKINSKALQDFLASSR